MFYIFYENDYKTKNNKSYEIFNKYFINLNKIISINENNFMININNLNT